MFFKTEGLIWNSIPPITNRSGTDPERTNDKMNNVISSAPRCRPGALTTLAILASVTCATAELVTYNFAGTLEGSNSLFNAGDTFTGSYTFETEVEGRDHPDSTLSFSYVAIHESLAETQWQLTVFSSTIGDFSLIGNQGSIAVGNDIPDHGDRYIVTLANSPALTLPEDLTLNFFQIDLSDSSGQMLSSNSAGSLPNLSFAHVSGRFFSDSPVCSQCPHAISVLTAPLDEDPTAVAGPNQSTRPGERVFLDGTGSFDDNTSSEFLLYDWQFTAMPADSVAQLDDRNSATPSFVADVAGVYSLRLVVTDDSGHASPSDEVTVSSDNLAPTAVASSSFSIALIGELFHLDGTGSSDPENDPIFYQWDLISVPTGSAATLLDAETAHPSFTPDLEGTYLLSLQASDLIGPGELNSLEVAAVTADAYARSLIMEASDRVDLLSNDQVTSVGNRKALSKQLREAILQAGESASDEPRITQLQLAIKRIDGYPTTGTLDEAGPTRDWVTDPLEQQELYELLTAAEEALAP